MSLNNNGTDAVRRRKVVNGNGSSLSSSSQHLRKERRKKSSQRRSISREGNNNHKLVLVFLASFTTVGIILFLCLRSPSEVKSDHQIRYEGGSGKPRLRKDTTANYEGMRYLDPRQLPPLPGHPLEPYFGKGRKGGFRGEGDDEWQSNADAAISNNNNNHDNLGPNVDYTKHTYEYPELMFEPPNDGTYPPLYEMSSIFETWGQDDLDNPPETLVEVLQHFDYQNPEHLEAAIKYRDLELPFKVYNVPEVAVANLKWTDEYLSSQFDDGKDSNGIPHSNGGAQMSIDNFFAFYRPNLWNEDLLGASPSIDLDWTFEKFAKHRAYADNVNLPSNEKHYYFQSGVPREERLGKKKHWTFVSRDLPSFSSPEPTFFGFNPPAQKGIQCRFGERGVTAATHYDGGRNMIAMITGAKRYILSPPNACPKLGIVSSRKHPSFRHSMLNFGRMTLLDKEDSNQVDMSSREKEWLRIAASAPTLSTVLNSGEVLYVPSHWFHYIVSLQKSAQCNTRSGIHEDGNPNFGGLDTVEQCTSDGDESD